MMMKTYLVQRGQLSPSLFGFTSTAWGRSYRGIRECNLALEKVPEMDIPTEKRDFLLAELRFYQSLEILHIIERIWRCTADW